MAHTQKLKPALGVTYQLIVLCRFSYGMSGIFWLFLNWGHYTRNWKKMALTLLNLFVVAMGAAVCGIGLYASGKAIHDESGSSSWSCADNSAS